MLLDGKKVRDEILEDLKNKISDEKLDLCLAIIFAGTDKPSEVYVNNKIKYANKIGIKTKLIRLIETTEEEIISFIKDLNKDASVTGIILQSPVPKNVDIENCLKYILPSKDIDGFTKENYYNLGHNQKGIRPCTVKGIMRLLDYYDISVSGKNVCIIGRGNLVGRPLALEMINNGATVTVCNSLTKDLKNVCKANDIVISCAGCAGLIKKDMINDGAIVIDVGISVTGGKIIGDVDFENVKTKCSYITPNPGGIGPMTIAMVLENVYEASK